MAEGKEAVRETPEGVLLEVRVKPNSDRFSLSRREGRLVLEVASPPREGEANTEIVKGLKRLFRKDIEIVRGLKGKDKVILVRDGKASEMEKAIEQI
jgi:uncharacterized protein (TIGR00251 family)